MSGPSMNSNARSITCITGTNLSSNILSSNPLNVQASPATYGMVPYHKSSIPGLYSYQGQHGRVNVIGASGLQGVGTGSPTKSMSSGLCYKVLGSSYIKVLHTKEACPFMKNISIVFRINV